MYDDQSTYFEGLISFMDDVERGAVQSKLPESASPLR